MPGIRAQGTPAFSALSGTFSIGVPAHSTGDLLLLLLGSSANASTTPTHAAPGDWTLLATAANSSGATRARCSVYYKITAGGEADPSVTCTPVGLTACHHSGVVFSVNVPNASAPYELVTTAEVPDASSALLNLAAPDGGGRYSFLVAHHADDIATGVTENSGLGFSLLVGTDNATGIDGFLAVFGLEDNDSAATATITFADGGTGAGVAGVAFNLVPLPDPVVGSFGSMLPIPTSSMQAVAGVAGSMVGELPASTGVMDGAHGVAGEISGTLEAPSSAMAGAHGVAGDLATTLPGPGGMISSAHGVAGALASVLPISNSAIQAITPIHPTATLSVVAGPSATLVKA